MTVGAEAIGQPGQRRFRIYAVVESGVSVSLWLEKEQLIALGDAIETVLAGEEFEYVPLPPDDRPPEPVLPLNPDYDFRIGQLSMGVDKEDRTIVVIATEATDDDESAAAIAFSFPFWRGYELREQIKVVVAAGRPPCPLCGAPLDPSGHICPRQNGHHKQA